VPLMKITKPGLVAIGCAVALLWTCILAERGVMRRALSERAAVMRGLEQMRRGKRRNQPVLAPGVYFPRPARPIPG